MAAFTWVSLVVKVADTSVSGSSRFPVRTVAFACSIFTSTTRSGGKTESPPNVPAIRAKVTRPPGSCNVSGRRMRTNPASSWVWPDTSSRYASSRKVTDPLTAKRSPPNSVSVSVLSS